jgi:hypothetical protein
VTSSEKSAAGDRGGNREPAPAPAGSFNRQYDDYQAALRTIGEESAVARRDAASTYRRKVADAVAEAYAPAREAYLKYLGAYFESNTGGMEAPDPQVVRAEFDYREADRRAGETASGACEDEWHAYCDRITQIDQEDASRWKAAFDDYFGGVGRVVADLDHPDPRDVQVLAQTLSLACVSALSGTSG